MSRQCPKCRGEFEEIDYLGVSVERCLDCAGIWFDFAEREELMDIEGTETIDSGNVSELHQQIRDIDCLNCGKRMLEMKDPDQPHIEYEVCPKCYAVFLDAGEFRDMKELTLTEWARQQIARIR